MGVKEKVGGGEEDKLRLWVGGAFVWEYCKFSLQWTIFVYNSFLMFVSRNCMEGRFAPHSRLDL